MKIHCDKNKLAKSISISLKAVSAKTTMPILECILIEADERGIVLTTNDMELGIETKVEGTIEQKGKIALDAKIFSEIIRRLPDNIVTIETDEQYHATITCEKAKFNIPGKEGDDFAYLPSIEKKQYVSLSQFTLKEIIRQTIFSISDTGNNRMMSGELMEVQENTLKLVSLDGHRVSIRKVTLKDSYDPVKVVIPGKTLNEISKILTGDADSEMLIFFSQNHIMFEFDDTIVVSRLIEGEYFHIDQMLSGDYETEITINKRELLNCIDRSTLLVKESDKKPVIIGVQEDHMELKLVSSMGSMREDIQIEKHGKDILIAFNPKFLMDVLRVIDDEEIHIYMVNPKAPCFIRDQEESYIYLILPVNFNAA